jgi:hypothetical protein
MQLDRVAVTNIRVQKEASMSVENRYVYFSMSSRQLELLLAALLRSLSRVSVLGDGVNETHRLEALEIEAVHRILNNLRNTDHAMVKVILSEAQFSIVSISVKTAQLSLTINHALKNEYDELAATLDARRISRRSVSRDESETRGTAKI